MVKFFFQIYLPGNIDKSIGLRHFRTRNTHLFRPSIEKPDALTMGTYSAPAPPGWKIFLSFWGFGVSGKALYRLYCKEFLKPLTFIPGSS